MSINKKTAGQCPAANFSLFLFVAIAAISFASCGGNSKPAQNADSTADSMAADSMVDSVHADSVAADSVAADSVK